MTLQNYLFHGTFCLAFGVFGTIATSISAQDETGFRGEGEGDWYHPLEVDEWVSLGADQGVVDAILSRIAEAEGPRQDDEMPDTLLNAGPGHWITEWTMAGAEAFLAAQSAPDPSAAFASARAAVVYYHLASAPHTNDPMQREALDLAGQAYMFAADLSGYDVQEMQLQHENKSFGAYVHLPQGDAPFPVVVVSNGSDQSKEMLFGYFDEFLAEDGIAMITIDIPGMGDSAAFDILDGNTEKLHLAAAQWAGQQPMFDKENVFVQGGSFGGNSAAGAFIASEDYNLAGVISECAPLDAPFQMPAEVYEMLPAFTIDGVRARVGLEAGSDVNIFADRVRATALSARALMEGHSVSTPLLVISTTEDPVAPLDDLDLFTKQATNLTRVVLDEEGHCPDSVSSDLIAAHWISNNLR